MTTKFSCVSVFKRLERKRKWLSLGCDLRWNISSSSLLFLLVVQAKAWTVCILLLDPYTLHKGFLLQYIAVVFDNQQLVLCNRWYISGFGDGTQLDLMKDFVFSAWSVEEYIILTHEMSLYIRQILSEDILVSPKL